MTKRGIVAGLAICSVCLICDGASLAAPACTPFDASGWKSLIDFRPSPELQSALNQHGWHPQDLSQGVSRNVNLDYYAVDISNLPTLGGKEMTSNSFLEFIRSRLNFFVDHSLGSFSPGNETERADWIAGKIGSKVVFDMEIPTISPVPRIARPAQVVLIDKGPDYWRFATGWDIPPKHPVSGVREFGIKTLPNGHSLFYTRGADRISDSPIDSLLENMIFDSGDASWRGMMDRVLDFVSTHSGQASLSAPSVNRPCWEDVSTQSGSSDSGAKPFDPAGWMQNFLTASRNDDGTIFITTLNSPNEGLYIWPDGSLFFGTLRPANGHYLSATHDSFTGSFTGLPGQFVAGTFESADAEFSGQYITGHPSSGEWQMADGVKFKGNTNFAGDIFSGRDGTWMFPNGDSYTGTSDAAGNKLTGNYKWANGQQYAGKFNEGAPSDGAWMFPDGDSYTGTVDAAGNKLTGTYKWANGSTFVGSYSNGHPWDGKYFSADGHQASVSEGNSSPGINIPPVVIPLILMGGLEGGKLYKTYMTPTGATP
jgi:hypothetical protein